MTTKTKFSEKTARNIAQAWGLRVTTTGKTGTLKQLMVGKLLVQHDAHYGGAASWRVGSICVGNKGEAMAVAAEAQGPWLDSPFTPNTTLSRAFNQLRKENPALRRAA